MMLKEVMERVNSLKQVINEKRLKIQGAPDGVLSVVMTKRRVEYYVREKSVCSKRRYLKRNEKELIQALAQKEYDQLVLIMAEKEIKHLERFISNYPKQTFEDVYASLSEPRKALVFPAALSDEEFIKSWQQEEFVTKGTGGLSSEFYTDRGERVRSKTEILIANALNRHGIPYRYECPLYLDGYGTVHPDFTVLNVRDRKEMYWEHLGMMDSKEYAQSALERIEMYERNDILPGDRLILTHETSASPVSSKSIEKMILTYLL